jgi:hypothetical protein
MIDMTTLRNLGTTGLMPAEDFPIRTIRHDQIKTLLLAICPLFVNSEFRSGQSPTIGQDFGAAC